MGILRSSITNKEKRMLQKLMSESWNDEAKELAKLKNKLKQVAMLCRLFNKKVQIRYANTEAEVKTITARVWLTTCTKIVFKDGFSIPTSSIKEIKVL